MDIKIDNLSKEKLIELMASASIGDVITDLNTRTNYTKTEFGYLTSTSAINAVISSIEPVGEFPDGTFWIKI